MTVNVVIKPSSQITTSDIRVGYFSSTYMLTLWIHYTLDHIEGPKDVCSKGISVAVDL